MSKLEKLLDEFESFIPNWEVVNTAVSAASVGWHIEHSFLVLNKVMDGLAKSNPEEYKNSFNIMKTIVFTTGVIPRGKAKAPKAVIPAGDFTKESLETLFASTKNRIGGFNHFQKRNFIVHPYFGKLHLKDTQTMLRIHTKHHLKIIKDILKG